MTDASVEAAPRPTRGETWLGFTAGFVLVLTPILGYLAPLAFAPLMGIAGVMALPLLRRRWGSILPLAPLVLLAIWALISLDWSPYIDLKPKAALENALKLPLQLALYGSAVLAFAQLAARSARRAQAVLAGGAGALALILFVDALLGATLYQAVKQAIGEPIRPDLARRNIAQGNYVLAVLFWPAAVAAWRSGWKLAAPGAGLLLIGASGLLGADAPILALVLGGAAFAAVRYGGRIAGLAFIPPIALYFVLTPILTLEAARGGLFAWLHRVVGQSWDARLDIWAFSAAKVLEKPALGWGFDASRTFDPAIPLHPHNAALQLWLELGAIGAALGAVFFCCTAFSLANRAEENRVEAAAGFGALIAYLTIGAISFGVWQEWWLGLGALGACSCILLHRSRG
ncbi:O-antigen ligase family protein [Caulobacter segnis]|uniref:O-antigen ligase family protein n=1 Tax=Caulobacter segnis TaxID=88688 RepID=UPI00240F4BCA|nr:O-antigen ligase family protein [Caulobacter segnis]MDG2523088.1 O-antigen ligase family protein [Caulobacter segnis]